MKTEIILDSIETAMALRDNEGRHLWINRSYAEKIIGLNKGDIEKRTLNDFEDMLGRGKVRYMREKDRELILKGGTRCRTITITDKNNSKKEYLAIEERIKIGRDKDGILSLMTESDPERYLSEMSLLKNKALESAINAIAVTNYQGDIVWVNSAFNKMTGYSFEECKYKNMKILKSGKQDSGFYKILWETIKSDKVWKGELINRRKDGTTYYEEMTITPVKNAADDITHFIAVKEDITEHKIMQAKISHNQKMESIGTLAAGIAHEINSPAQFINDNLYFLKDSYVSLNKILNLIKGAIDSIQDIDPNKLRGQVKEIWEVNDIDYISKEVPLAIEQSLDGIRRIASIVNAMKEFAHTGPQEQKYTDIHSNINNTLIVSKNKWKYCADIETDLDVNMPHVLCYPDELNQVFLNLIVNACDTIAEKNKETGRLKGKIKITTKKMDDKAVIEVSDDGMGIPANIQSRIFDLFFTTKEVGKGTGQGLALAHSIIIEKHTGEIIFKSIEDTGTTFIITIPINGRKRAENEA